MQIIIFYFFYAFLLVDSKNKYTNEFAVEFIEDRFNDSFDFKSYNLEIVRQVNSLGNVFHLKRKTSSDDDRNDKSKMDYIEEMLKKHPAVRRVEKQVDLEVEQKTGFNQIYDDKSPNKDFIKSLFDDMINYKQKVFNTVYNIEMKHENVLDTAYSIHKLNLKPFETDYEDEEEHSENLDTDSFDREIKLTEDDKYYRNLVKQRQERVKNVHFNDPEADNLWQYNNYGQFHGVNPGFDMNIYPVYLANYTGQGVVVTVIDDGLDTHHREIARNFDPAASMDFNNPYTYVASPRGPVDRDTIPKDEGHGTLCASVIGAVANNRFCAFGVAYNVNLGGIRMLARNMVTDLLEAYALTHNNQYISIYSNSWGPKDNGEKTAPLTFYVAKALEAGADKGRNGKGSIVLFAAGNGGVNYDHCGADGLVNSPFTFAVTAVNIYGKKPSYTEECTAISITAAVGGYGFEEFYERNEIDPSLIASRINGQCSKRFLGTSAAVPVVAGCIALMLEANPTVSWRDIQHLMSISARMPNSKDTVWQLNTAGLLFSDNYGSGLLDCSALVANALKWKNVGPRRSCIAGRKRKYDDFDKIIRRKHRTRITFDTSACKDTLESIDFLEHVLIHTNITHHCRGDLTIVLTSPTGTRSDLLKNRRWDYNNRTISFSSLSLMHWGEKPRGTWNLDIIDSGLCETSERIYSGERTGKIENVTLEFFGTSKLDSAVYRNGNLINDYLRNIKIEIPRKSIILNEQKVYDIFNEQRKYFIRMAPSDRKVPFWKRSEDNWIANHGIWTGTLLSSYHLHLYHLLVLLLHI